MKDARQPKASPDAKTLLGHEADQGLNPKNGGGWKMMFLSNWLFLFF